MSSQDIDIPESLVSEKEFYLRFKEGECIQDALGRDFSIAEDRLTGKRTILKRYLESMEVLENIRTYEKLRSTNGLSKILSCAKNTEEELIVAFEYDEYTLQECIDLHLFDKTRQSFYLLALSELASTISHSLYLGLEIEDLSFQSVLVYREAGQEHIKILYDEREVSCASAVEKRAKIFWTAQKLTSRVKGSNGSKEDLLESTSEEEAVFQLGLLFLDFICSYELTCDDSPHKIALKDSWHINLNGVLKIDNAQMKAEIQYLLGLQRPAITELVELLKGMVGPAVHRFDLETLSSELSLLKKRQSDHELDSPPVSPNSSKKIHRPTGKDIDRLAEVLEVDKQSSKTSILPLNSLLQDLTAEKAVMDKLHLFLPELQNGAQKKYYDGSFYYGALDQNKKRMGKGLYMYGQGDVYFGEWKDNQLIKGIYIFKNGESFEGVVHKGKQGWGVYRYANGNVYEGNWKDDLKEGKGNMKYANNDIYEGEWRKGKKEGDGNYYYSNGTIYRGGFKDGRKEGKGKLTFENGTVVEAIWQGTHVEGYGKIFFANGNYYEGNFHFSEKEGQGLYCWEDCQYEGEFLKDEIEGSGKITFNTEEHFQGRVKNGRKGGYGNYKYPNGDEFVGEWRDDHKIMGNYTFANGDRFEGRFKQNQVFFGLMTYSNGQSYEGQFADGKRSGVGCYRDKEGRIVCEGKWEADKFISH